MKFENLSEDIQAIVRNAEEIAIDNIRNGIAFSPFIFWGEKSLKKIVGKALEESIKVAVEVIENMREETVLIIYRDVITLNDGSVDAIITEIYNDDEDFGYSFGLGYKITDDNLSFLNERFFLGKIRNCLVY